MQTIQAFDRTRSVRGRIETPDRYRHLETLLGKGLKCPRGAGSSYALASAGDDVTSISSKHFDRILAFDPANRTITIESGLSLGKLSQFLLSHDLWFPVLPGHPSITVGGAIAFNIHGKSQSAYGCFGEHINKMHLLSPGGKHLELLPHDDAFDLTVGGMGLTGFIVSAELKLQSIRAQSIERTRIAVNNLEDAAKMMIEKAADNLQIYSWNNFCAKGDSFGRGFVYLERFSERPAPAFKGFGRLRYGRSGVLKDLLTKPIRGRLSWCYEMAERFKRSTEYLNVLAGSFPFSGKEFYHDLFGREGLLESQLIVPLASWSNFRKGFAALCRKHAPPFALGSLKLFSGESTWLRFDGSGICVSLDVPNSRIGRDFFEELDQLVIELGLIPNLAKDSRIPPEVVKATFKDYERFRRAIREFDPGATMDSELRRRLLL